MTVRLLLTIKGMLTCHQAFATSVLATSVYVLKDSRCFFERSRLDWQSRAHFGPIRLPCTARSEWSNLIKTFADKNSGTEDLKHGQEDNRNH